MTNSIGSLKALSLEVVGSLVELKKYFTIRQRVPKFHEKVMHLILHSGLEGRAWVENLSPTCINSLLKLASYVKLPEAELNAYRTILLRVQQRSLRFQERQFINNLIRNPTEPVQAGYGEYIVFLDQELPKELFEQVYAVFCRYSHGAIIERNRENEEAIREEYLQRYEKIRDAVKAVDSHLEIAFIPRTLYELSLLRKWIREDIKKGFSCPLLEPKMHHPPPEWEETVCILRAEELSQNPKCWHRICHNSLGTLGEMQEEGVIEIAYRLNRCIAKKCTALSKPLSYQEIAALTEKEITFLKEFYQEGVHEQGNQALFTVNPHAPGPAAEFGSNSTGLREGEEDATLIRKIAALECSDVALKSLFLYRGGKRLPLDDHPYDRTEPDRPFSLSFGGSLFAGFRDKGAMAFRCMRNEAHGYAFIIPIEKALSGPLYIPPTSGPLPCDEVGEIFHGRSKVWGGISLRNGVAGVQQDEKRLDHLQSSLSREEFLVQFAHYQKTACILK
jgi:hypothetical protein